MTWLTTWPARSGKPKYAAHDTEAAAEAHADELKAADNATTATVFWVNNEEQT